MNPAMAKRARGTVRPGQRRPTDRRPASAVTPSAASGATTSPRPSGLTEAEAKRAAELEAQFVAEERAADAARTKRTVERPGARSGAGTLTLRAEEEYAYVARDVKRIGRVALILLVILFGLWILVDVAKVMPIG